MQLTFLADSQGALANGATIPATSYSTVGDPALGTIYSGVKFDADGSIYKRSAAGTWQRFGTWMLSGANTDYSVSRGTVTGTLTTDAGAGPLQLSTDRIYDVQNSTSSSTVTASAVFTIQDWNGGSPTVTYDTASIALSAEMESP